VGWFLSWFGFWWGSEWYGFYLVVVDFWLLVSGGGVFGYGSWAWGWVLCFWVGFLGVVGGWLGCGCVWVGSLRDFCWDLFVV